MLQYAELPDYIHMEFDFAKRCSDIYQNGIAFDLKYANRLIDELTKQIADIDKQLVPQMPQVKKSLKPYINIYKKDGMFKNCVNEWMYVGHPYLIKDNTMERWTLEDPNPSSADQLRAYLLALGWKPRDDFDAWNYKQFTNKYGKKQKVTDEDGNYIRTTPKLPSNDDELEDLSKISPSFRLISTRLHASHRLHTIEGYIKNLRADGRIPMGINSCGANTARVTHSIVANVPRITSYLGTELRSLFTCEEGKILVGCDADGLEARTIAHYFNDPIFTELIMYGDVHQYMYDTYFKEYVKDRSSTKNLIYAFVYGARAPKLGSMANNKPIGNVKQIGEEIIQLFSEAIPGMTKLTKLLDEAYELRGGIKGLDGRFIRCRKKSSVLNTLCQSAGAIACKRWTVMYRDEIRAKRLDSKHIIFYHDSNTEECKPEIASQIGTIMVDCLRKAGEYYNLRLPLTAKYSIGKTWANVK